MIVSCVNVKMTQRGVHFDFWFEREKPPVRVCSVSLKSKENICNVLTFDKIRKRDGLFVSDLY